MIEIEKKIPAYPAQLPGEPIADLGYHSGQFNVTYKVDRILTS
jgi:hypothetical protein